MIAGGSGMIGTGLSKRLVQGGHEVRLLTRHPELDHSYPAFGWDVAAGKMDPQALLDVDVIISLAGAGIADRRWSKSRKQILLKSRVSGNNLIFETLQRHQQRISQFIGASAIGIYGDRGEKILTESSEPGEGFMSELCNTWEQSQRQFGEITDQLAHVRIGLVLAKEGGILPTMYHSIFAGIGASLGSGTQYMSWIHLIDLLRIFELLLSAPHLQGAFNAVSPSPIQHRQFMRHLVNQKGGLGWVLPIPSLAIRLVLGEMAQVVLDSTRVVPKRLMAEGFAFDYVDLDQALKSLPPI